MKQNVIAHVNFAKGFRGGERQTLLLVKELANRGYRQQIFTRVESELANRLEGVNNLEIVKIKKPYIFSMPKIKSASVIQAHETKGAQFAFFANLFYKIPYIVTRRVVNPIKNNFFNRLIYKNARYTVVLSKAIKEEVVKISDKADIKTIPDCYSQLGYNQDGVNALKKRFADKFIIGSIGELDNEIKGQFYLIEALKMLEKEYPDIQLVLLGRGKDLKKFQEQSKNMQNVTIEGFVDNVGDYIKCFDLFVFPSLKEGLGSSLLDIMEFEVPIIATNVGGIPDIIQNGYNGMLIDSKDSQAICDAIIKLYTNRDLSKKYTQNAKINLFNYSIDSITTSYEECYGTVLNKDIMPS